jgi:hypothetical protein
MTTVNSFSEDIVEFPEDANVSRSSTLCSFDGTAKYPSIKSQNQEESKAAFHTSFLHKFSPATTFYQIDLEKSVLIETQTPQSWHQKLSDLLVNWWAWELCCWLVSALCMFAISVLLGLYDNKQLPKKWPLGITLNAYISVLSGVVKLALAVSTATFDSAQHLNAERRN